MPSGSFDYAWGLYGVAGSVSFVWFSEHTRERILWAVCATAWTGRGVVDDVSRWSAGASEPGAVVGTEAAGIGKPARPPPRGG